ncbi:MAG: hypothetical protein ACOC4G_10800, partial [Bacillota bacterium]
MKNHFKKYWPIIFSVLILLSVLFILINISFKRNEGVFVYALDDPYIHMSIAKNLVQEKVFGVTKYEFSFSTSSPLYTLLLSFFYYIFSPNEITP